MELRPRRVVVKFEPRDLWVGIYWDRRRLFEAPMQASYGSATICHQLDVYICVVPLFPIKLTWLTTRTAKAP